MANKNNRSFRQCVASQFNMKPIKTTNQNLNHNSSTRSKQASISKVPLPIPPRLSKSILAKSKYSKKNFTTNTDNKSTNYFYAKDIAKIKNTFMKLFTQKVMDIHKVLNNTNKKEKPKINITTKGSLRKQDIVPMSLNNMNRIMTKSNKHIININRSLKEIKFNISVNYI